MTCVLGTKVRATKKSIIGKGVTIGNNVTLEKKAIVKDERCCARRNSSYKKKFTFRNLSQKKTNEF